MIWNLPCSYSLAHILSNSYQASTNGLTTNRFLQNLNNIIKQQNKATIISNWLLGWSHHEPIDSYILLISQMTMDLFSFTYLFSFLYHKQSFIFWVVVKWRELFFIIYKIISEIRVSDCLQWVVSSIVCCLFFFHKHRNKRKWLQLS